jgi:hypothetical protein
MGLGEWAEERGVVDVDWEWKMEVWDDVVGDGSAGGVENWIELKTLGNPLGARDPPFSVKTV